MQYKLMAVDMDGTLLTSEKTISPKTVCAIEKAYAAGKVVTISTGRPVQGLSKYEDVIKPDVPVITYNGAMIIKLHSKEVLFHQCIDKASAKEAIEKGIEIGTTVVVWSDNKLYANKINERVDSYKLLSGLEPIIIEDIDALVEQGVTKLLWLDEAEKHFKHQEWLDKTLVNKKIVYCTSQPTFLEFMGEGVSKAVALERLGQMLGSTREEAIAVGDGFNDLEMIEYAGLGVAMENAPEGVKAKADYITDSNDEDGVAKAIEKFML